MKYIYEENIIDETGIDNLKTLTYKDLYINNLALRILGIHYMNFGENWDIATHRHSFYEMHYVVSGCANTVINGREYDIGEGYFYIMPPGTRHSHFQKNKTSHIGIALRWEYPEFAGEKLKNIFDAKEIYNRIDEKIIPGPLKDSGEVLCGICEMIKMSKENYQNISLQLAVFSIIERALKLCGHIVRETGNYLNTGNENKALEMAIKFVNDNCCENIKVTDVANSVHISYSHLAKLFREQRGETLNNYINRMRMQKGFKLLTCTDMTLAQIANETGFENSNYFCKVFRKIHKKSPGSVRREFSQLPDE